MRGYHDLSTLKMEAISSSETSVNSRPIQRHIPDDDILHVHVIVWLRNTTGKLWNGKHYVLFDFRNF
jgi:hypothetical protein